MGSLQEFVRHDDVASDLAPSQFSSHQVHKIVLLDMRLLNTDRNDANILVRKRRSATTGKVDYELIPIDHGYCLPQFLEIAWCDWCWYNWPQLHEPLSPEDRRYVLSMSAQDDAHQLAKKIPLRNACRRNMIIAGMVVQKGVKANLVLFEIARIMCREDLDAPSLLEKLCLEAFHQLQAANQQKLYDNTSTALASPRSSFSQRRSSFNMPLTIEIPPMRDSLINDSTESVAHSPPGFWASFAPFGSDDEDERDCPTSSSSENESTTAGGREPTSSLDWDHMAKNALSDAIHRMENGDGHSTIKPTLTVTTSGSGKWHDSPNGFSLSSEAGGRPRSPTASFIGNDGDKDEFELLNDALDDSPQDEKLFLSILGRLIDDKVEEALRQQQCKRAADGDNRRRAAR